LHPRVSALLLPLAQRGEILPASWQWFAWGSHQTHCASGSSRSPKASKSPSRNAPRTESAVPLLMPASIPPVRHRVEQARKSEVSYGFAVVLVAHAEHPGERVPLGAKVVQQAGARCIVEDVAAPDTASR
jgi:hypothetical protein